MGRKLSILNIGGHPKDPIIYAGGTMALHVERGDSVTALAATHGLSHHGKGIDEFIKTGKRPDIGALIEERKQELVEAAAEVGVTDVRFLGHDDWIDLPDRRLAEDIADVIGEVRPDVIISHWPDDSVPAHANVTRMMLLAVNAAAGIRIDSPHAPHSVRQIFFHTQQGLTNVLENSRVHNPTTVIDITPVIRKKANAMNRFTSQYYGEDSPLQRKLSESLDGSIQAIHSKVPYAEAFIAFKPELHRSLPVSEYAMELAEQSEAESYEYLTQMLLDPKK